MALQKNGSANRSLLRPSLFIYNVYKVQNSINHMLNPSADRDVNNIYQLSTEKARQWWNNQAFESRKNIVIESEAVINDDKLVEDQTIADIADKDYDDLPDTTKQEVELQVEDYEEMEELFEVKDDEYLKCSMCEDIFTSNDDYELHKSVDHGEEPEDFEESEETYQLTMHPELTRESLRKANNLLTETEERQLYSNYDKNGDVQSSIMPYNLPPVATGKYNDNPNKFFYSNKIFRAGSSTERTSSLGESKASESSETKDKILSMLKNTPQGIPNYPFSFGINADDYNDAVMELDREGKIQSFFMDDVSQSTNGYKGEWWLMSNESKASESLVYAKIFKMSNDGMFGGEIQLVAEGKNKELTEEESLRIKDQYNMKTESGGYTGYVDESEFGIGESKSSEYWEDDGGDQDAIADGLADLQDWKVYCKICGKQDYEHRSHYPQSYGDMSGQGNMSPEITDHVFVLDESRINEAFSWNSQEFDISKYYKEVTEDGWMDYQCNSCGKKIDPDDGYGDQKDYDVIIQELKDHQINHKFIYESTDRFEADIENDQVVQKLPDDKRSFDVEASENNLYRSPDGEFNEQWENAYWDNRLSNAMEDNYGYEQIMEDILRLMDSDSTHSDYYNMRYQQVADAERNRGLGGESKATEKGEWDWLDKGSDSKSVDYDEVEYKDDGVSDISIQNAEPKLKDQNAFLDNVNIGVESVDYVYKTKAHEAMEKTYIPVSETFEEDYEEFEDSDEAMIKETITLRKLTGYGDDAIARELNINYGVSHEEALEKVYSVEVSTNDRVSQTFFGKMYRECTESEKDELRMYSGSD